jgi:hypothetical protein
MHARTTVPLELTATTELPAPVASAPVAEPEEAVTEPVTGEITEMHERSGVATRSDHRREWPPDAEVAAADELAAADTTEEIAAPPPPEDAVGEPTEEIAASPREDDIGEPTEQIAAFPREDDIGEPTEAIRRDEEVAPAPVAVAAPPATPRGKPVRLRAALGAAALLAVAAVAGIVAGGSGEEEQPAPAAEPEAVSFEAGPLAFRGPAGWSRREAPELQGLELRDAAAVGNGDAAMVAGLTNAGEATLLPGGFSEARPDDAVTIGGAHAYRYEDVRIEGTSGDVTLLAAPTTEGVATIACLGSPDQRRRCEAAAGSLVLADGVRAFRLGPSERYARELASATDRLASRRAAGLRRMRAAGTPKAQAAAASDVATAYRKAAGAIGRVEPNPPERVAHAALRRAVAGAGDDYAAVAAAARKQRRSGYEQASKRARAADGAVNNALTRLRALGYKVR